MRKRKNEEKKRRRKKKSNGKKAKGPFGDKVIKNPASYVYTFFSGK